MGVGRRMKKVGACGLLSPRLTGKGYQFGGIIRGRAEMRFGGRTPTIFSPKTVYSSGIGKDEEKGFPEEIDLREKQIPSQV